MGKIVETKDTYDDFGRLVGRQTTTTTTAVEEDYDDCECCTGCDFEDCDCGDWECEDSDLVTAGDVLKKVAIAGAAVLGGLAIVKLIRRIIR